MTIPLCSDHPDTAESFHLRLPSSMIRRIDELARKENRTRANMLRCLLLRALDLYEDQKKAS